MSPLKAAPDAVIVQTDGLEVLDALERGLGTIARPD